MGLFGALGHALNPMNAPGMKTVGKTMGKLPGMQTMGKLPGMKTMSNVTPGMQGAFNQQPKPMTGVGPSPKFNPSGPMQGQQNFNPQQQQQMQQQMGQMGLPFGQSKQMQQPMQMPPWMQQRPQMQMQQGQMNDGPRQMPPMQQQRGWEPPQRMDFMGPTQEMNRPMVDPMMERPGGIGGGGFQRFDRSRMY